MSGLASSFRNAGCPPMSVADIQPDEAGAKPSAPPTQKTRKALSNLKRELTDEELGSTGVQKLLIDEVEKTSEENSELRGFREKFHEIDKKCEVLAAKQKTAISIEIISMACLAVGAAALGFAPSLWPHQPAGWISIAFGAVLLILGAAAKAIRL